MTQRGIAIALAVCLMIVSLAVVATRRAGDIAAALDDGDAGRATTSPVIRPLSAEDHFLGNPNAAVTFVVYNDFECPFCQAFHPTAVSLVEALGQNGSVSVAFRHFPNDARHSRARDAAVASECVADIAGDEKFYSYADIVYAGAPDSLSEEALVAAATGLGVDAAALADCRAGEDASAQVERDFRDGLELAKNDPAFGTPYIVAISREGGQVTLSGNVTRAELIDVANVLLGGSEE